MRWRINWTLFLKLIFYWAAIEGFLMLVVILLSVGDHPFKISIEIAEVIIYVFIYGLGFPLILINQHFHNLYPLNIPGYILFMLVNNTIQIILFTGIKRLMARIIKRRYNIKENNHPRSTNNEQRSTTSRISSSSHP
jgi:hypothetical protein